MGRKKKKVPVGGNTPERRDTTPASSVKQLVYERINLQLLASSKGNEKDPPQIRLTEADASSLEVTAGDRVFVLIQEDNQSLKASAICRVNVIMNASPQTPRQSPATSPGKSRLLVGWCQIGPPSLLKRFFPTQDSKPEVTPKKATPEKLSFPLPSSPSPSKQGGFSFARGGGGDKLISPTSSLQLKSPSQRSFRSSRSQEVVIVPIFSSLGIKISALLCREGRQLGLRATSVIPANCLQIVGALAKAYCGERYLNPADIITISFQGKALEFSIESLEGDSQVEEPPMGLMENLQLEETVDDPESLSLLSCIRRTEKDGEKWGEVALFFVGKKATINILQESDEPSLTAVTRRKKTRKWAIVAGLDSCISQIKDVILPPLLRPDMYGSLKPPRGLLLHGPSGVGKSTLATQICNDIENEFGVTTHMVHCASLQSHAAIVGEAEHRLSQLFQNLNQALLVLDDVHLICPKRGGRASASNMDRLAATLLALLDGVRSDCRVVVLAITSNPSLLDPALRRPGRLDAEVEVPIPDEVARAKIIKLQLNDFKEAIDVEAISEEDFSALSRLAKGFTGADCMLSIKEAVRTSSSRNETIVSLDHLKESIRRTKPSTINSVTVEIPTVLWSSIGGMDNVKAQLRETIELPVSCAHLFAALHIPLPRGVLLYGPPGCSKTLMARALATEGQMNFLAVKGPELLSKWLGESERALASLFRRARLASPCIIFFDEIDAIAAKRGGGGSAGGERLLSQLLTELDGIGSAKSQNSRVIVVGATNRPDLLDSALVRPGRIDKMIYVGLPDAHSRSRIFEIGLKGKACSNNINIQYLASDDVSGGYSGAEIISVCREAALFAIDDCEPNRGMGEERLPEVEMEHLLRAIQVVRPQINQSMLDFYARFSKSSI